MFNKYHFLKTYLIYKATLLWQINDSDLRRFILWESESKNDSESWLQWELESESFLVNVNGGISIGIVWNCVEFWIVMVYDSDSTHLCSSDAGVN